MPRHSKDKLIVALDYPDMDSAKKLVEVLGDSVTFYKIGFELLMSGDYFTFIRWLEKKNKKVFADLKLHDISSTVGKAVKNLSQYPNVEFLTVHATTINMIKAASANKGHLKILGVTILTDLNHDDLRFGGGYDTSLSLDKLVLDKAQLACFCRADGVIASGHDAKAIRRARGDSFLIVTPGIRLESSLDSNDDQKRITTPKEAFENGANYIVVGRPITTSNNPIEEVEKFLYL